MVKKTLYLIAMLFASSIALMAQLETSRLTITSGVTNPVLKQTIEQNVTNFLSACNVAVMKGDKPKFHKDWSTTDARNRTLEIWNNSPFNYSVSTLERICAKRPAGGWQIRDIPVTMFDAPDDERNQEIVINLTADGRIDDVFVPVTQYTELLSASIEVEDINLRMTVLEFVENFRTAYNRRSIKDLEIMFSDDAIIIVGKEIKPLKTKDAHNVVVSTNSQFEYQVKTKAQYIASLRNIFKVNKYVNVGFDDIEVIRHPNPEYPVYGVTLKQAWRSTYYSDDGYVFLLIDFEEPKQPVITVRTWQPDKIDGRDLRPDEVFKMGDFIK